MHILAIQPSIHPSLQTVGNIETNPCVISEPEAGDEVDNDCDGRVDEENCDPHDGMTGTKILTSFLTLDLE